MSYAGLAFTYLGILDPVPPADINDKPISFSRLSMTETTLSSDQGLYQHIESVCCNTTRVSYLLAYPRYLQSDHRHFTIHPQHDQLCLTYIAYIRCPKRPS